MAVFMLTMPRRRTISGLFEISCGRMTMRFLKYSILDVMCCPGAPRAHGERAGGSKRAAAVVEQRHDAVLQHFGVHLEGRHFRVVGRARRARRWQCCPRRTAAAGTAPECAPPFISADQEIGHVLADLVGDGRGLRRRRRLRRSCSVRTTPAIFFGSTTQMRRADAVGGVIDRDLLARRRILAARKMSCMPSRALGWLAVELNQDLVGQPQVGIDAAPTAVDSTIPPPGVTSQASTTAQLHVAQEAVAHKLRQHRKGACRRISHCRC